MADELNYKELLMEFRGAMYPAQLELKGPYVKWTNTRNGTVKKFERSELEEIHWVLRAKGFALRIILKNDSIHYVDGFQDTEYSKLAGYIERHYDMKLQKKEMALKGWNWGEVLFHANMMEFRVDNLTAFDVPLSYVSHAQTAKNEVAIEFHPNDDAPVSLTEMRFYVPGDSSNKTDPVQDFFDKVMAKADVIQAAGDAITIFNEVQCLTPRGRYDIKIYPTFLQLHGKTFDYKILHSTILRLFLLPHRDGRQMFFVVSLDPPIKQGQTRYHFLIILFSKDTSTTLDLSLTDEEVEKHKGKLTKQMTGPEFEIISRIMKALVNKKITVPGSFLGHTGTQSIACSYRAATGSLYPLEKGFIFVHKPPLHIRFDEVGSVNFARNAGSTRSFDFDVETKTGTAYTFVGIEKEEYGKLYDFVQQKKLKIKNRDKSESKTSVTYSDDDESDDDHDAYLVKMKAEGKVRAVDVGGGDDDDDDEDESDEDFQPQGSASEPDDEYDSNPPSTASEDEVEGEDKGSESSSDEDAVPKPRKAEVKKPSKSKKEESEASSDDDEPAAKSKKPAKKSPPPKKTSSKKPKKEKDADRPKRPQSAYFLWFNDNRGKLKEAHPGLSVSELAKKAGEKWKEVTDKPKWEKRAAEEKKKYEVAIAEYNQKGGGSSAPTAAKKTQKKVTESFVGAKSKEFISESESSGSEDKPLKRKKKDSESDRAKSPDNVEMQSDVASSEDE